MVNFRGWQEARNTDRTGNFKAAEELSFELIRKWPRDKEVLKFIRSSCDEVRSLARLIDQLPERYHPRQKNPLAILLWAHLLTSALSSSQLGNK